MSSYRQKIGFTLSPEVASALGWPRLVLAERVSANQIEIRKAERRSKHARKTWYPDTHRAVRRRLRFRFARRFGASVPDGPLEVQYTAPERVVLRHLLPPADPITLV